MKYPSTVKNEYLDKVLRVHLERRAAIRKRLVEFSKVQPGEYFYELVYCLLTPQSSAANAEKVVSALRSAEFGRNNVDPEPFLRNKDAYIRFHRVKAGYLLKMKSQYPAIHQNILMATSASGLREWLVKNVLGIGYKEATHFLRNIGRNDGLAILDRHILRNLTRLSVIRSIPKTLSKKKYIQIEKRFSFFAESINIKLDELDLVFWSMETGEIRK